MICEVFKHDVSCRFNGAVAHHSAAEFEVDALKPNVLTVCKFDVVGPAEAGLEVVGSHAPAEFVEAPVVVGVVLRVQVEVSYWRVM